MAGPGDGLATTLSADELRVLACLIEKSHTTPDQYPLSTNALTAACNQKTSREPVVDYAASLVDQTMRLLRDGGWARSIRGSGNRTFKHRHVIDERLGLGPAQQAVVAVLALRGPQSAGELKTRTERYHPFADPAEVEEVLAGLRDREVPLVRNVGRASGQSQDRWIQLLGPIPGDAGGPVGVTPAGDASAEFAPPGPPPAEFAPSEPALAGPAEREPAVPPAGAGPRAGDDPVVEQLERRVAALEARLGELERELGLDPS